MHSRIVQDEAPASVAPGVASERIPFDSMFGPLEAEGLRSVGLMRTLIADGPASSVSFIPIELEPFAVECKFRAVEDADGTQRWAIVEPPHIMETRTSLHACAEPTPQHRRTLEENLWRYQRLAERIIDVDIKGAALARKAARESARRQRGKGDRWTVLERRDLLIRFEERGGGRGVLREIADEYGVWKSTISRQLERARAERAAP